MARLTLVPQKREFFDLYNQAASNAVAISQRLIELLDEFPAHADERMRDIKELEHAGDRLTHELDDEGDRLARAAIFELFSGGVDAISLIRWKDIHEQLEEAVDACENAADVLEAILVKNR